MEDEETYDAEDPSSQRNSEFQVGTETTEPLTEEQADALLEWKAEQEELSGIKSKGKAKKSTGKAKIATSFKRSFIRIFLHNDTQKDGSVDYTREYWIEQLNAWKEHAPKTVDKIYVSPIHTLDKDGLPGKPHIHIVLSFFQAVPKERLIAIMPYSDIEGAKDFKGCIRYLIHRDHAKKEQFAWDTIYTNDDNMEKWKTTENKQQEIELFIIAEQIKNGIINEINYADKIDNYFYAKHKSQIEALFKHQRDLIYMRQVRSLEVKFFSGETGTGKTTYAINICKIMGWTYAQSSSSNDPLQDYKGEDVLILDDMRDTAFTIEDLIKLTDPYTKSTVKSRFHNKAFLGNMIIITSNIPFDKWYKDGKKEDKDALYRRIEEVYEFEPEVVYRLVYNPDSKSDFPYDDIDYITNPLEEYRRKQESKITYNLFKTAGREVIRVSGDLLKERKAMKEKRSKKAVLKSK